MAPQTLLVVIGPSGSGKSTAVRELHARGLVLCHPTFTTRPRRPDERDGSLEHRFVSDETFDALQDEGVFVDVASLPGLPYRYGVPRLVELTSPIPAIIARAAFVPRLVPLAARTVVCQVETSLETARMRLLERGADDVTVRLGNHRLEIRAGRQVANRVIVNNAGLAEFIDAFTLALGAERAA